MAPNRIIHAVSRRAALCPLRPWSLYLSGDSISGTRPNLAGHQPRVRCDRTSGRPDAAPCVTESVATAELCNFIKCRIPFLTGGLFEPLGDYNRRKVNINLPDTLFTIPTTWTKARGNHQIFGGTWPGSAWGSHRSTRAGCGKTFLRSASDLAPADNKEVRCNQPAAKMAEFGSSRSLLG